MQPLNPKGNPMNEFNEGYDQYRKHRWSAGFKIIGLIVFITIISLVTRAALLPFWAAHTAMNTATGVVERVADPDNVLQNYEWFKQTYRDVLAADTKILTAERERSGFVEFAGNRDKWSFEDKTEYARLGSIATGLKNHREDLKAQYNARSKMLNRNIFKGKDVPYEIE